MKQAGPIFVSVVILGLYAAHMLGYAAAWTEGDAKLMDTCLTLVLGYWIGSSHGSDRKTEMLDK